MKVGTSGSDAERWRLATAIGASFPLFTWPPAPATAVNTQRDVAAERVGDRRAAALVRHVHELRAGA